MGAKRKHILIENQPFSTLLQNKTPDYQCSSINGLHFFLN